MLDFFDVLFYTFMACVVMGVVKFALQVRAARKKAISDARRQRYIDLYAEAKRLQDVAVECRSQGDHAGAHACHREIDDIYRLLRLPM